MRRREFIAGLGSAAAWPLMAGAQQRDRVRRVGLLMNSVEGDPAGQAEVEAFREALAKLGWEEGRNIDVQVRWPGASIELVERLAKALVEFKPDVLVPRSTPTFAALKRVGGIIPIVFVNLTAPIEQGFVQGLARPGGNITGFTNFDASSGGKMVQLLKEIDPRIVRVGIMYNPQTAPYGRLFVRSIEDAGPALGVESVDVPVQSDADIEAAVVGLAHQPGGGLVLIPDSFTNEHRAAIIKAVAHNRLPALYTAVFDRPLRGLMAYAVNTPDLMRRAAGYVDQILRGADPAQLPVQRPTHFDLVINRKVAEALGLAISPQLSVFADEIVE
jgi:putative tryptophan/tyrosine transport system substrate-binding protein